MPTSVKVSRVAPADTVAAGDGVTVGNEAVVVAGCCMAVGDAVRVAWGPPLQAASAASAKTPSVMT
jgi:hypothetical protein